MSKSYGTVKWFDTAKGYGFIINEAGEMSWCITALFRWRDLRT